MGILSRLEARVSAGEIGPPRDPVVAAWFGAGANSASGKVVTADTAMRITAVFRAVRLLAETYASLPLTVEKNIDGGHETDPTHPLYTLLRFQPNKWQTSFEWREMMAAHFALRGKCYSEKIATGGRGISALVPLHPDRVTPFRAPDGRLAFDYQPLDGPSRIILQSEMHYMHLMSMDGITPTSPIGLAREALGLALAAEEHGARVFSNGAQPAGLLKMKGHFKDEIAQERFRKSWEKVHGGVGRSSRVAILEDGLDWQQVGLTNEDAQFLETRQMQLAEIARIFGVPPHKIADLARSTNNNIEHQGIEFVTDTIRPGAVRWEQAMQRDLFENSRTHSAMFDLDDLMRGDSAARASYYASGLQNGYLTRNEVRQAEGRNVSQAEGMDGFTVQTNLTVVQLLEQIIGGSKNAQA